MIDTHAHLQLPRFNDDLDKVLERAVNQGVDRVINVGIDRDTSLAALEIEATRPMCSTVAGLHPNSAAGYPESGNLDWLEVLASETRIIAVGETGLDFYRDRASKTSQENAFKAHIRLAVKHDLPLVIHVRNAYDRVDEILSSTGGWGHKGVFHCFSGDRNFLEKAVDRGFYFSMGGPVTYRKSDRAELAAEFFDYLLLETDSPFLSPVPFRGKRNEPANIPYIAAAIGKALEMDGAEVGEACARRTFDCFPGLSGKASR